MPDLRNRYLQGNDIGGTIIEAGLPNIKGSFIAGYTISGNDNGVSDGVPRNGAFYGRFSHTRNYAIYNDVGGTLYFDASRCSPVYRNDITTVQPPAVTVRYYIRAK